MRLLLVSHRYPPDHSAGTELYTAQLAAGLVRRGHEVRVFTAEKDISAPDLCVREREHEGVRVFELVNNLHYDDPRQSWELPGAANAFACVVDEWKPDLIHFQHLLHLSVGCAEVARKSGAGVVMTLHDYWLQCARFGQRVHVEGTVCHEIDRARCAQCLSHFKYAQTPTEQRLAGWISGLKRKTGIDLGPAARGAGRALSRKADGDAADPDPRAEALWTERLAEREHDFRTRLLPSVDRFLSPSAFLRERFVEWGMSPDHIEHLPTGVDLDAFGRLPREPRGAEVRVAFLGSMIPAKGPDVLLEAWGRLTPEQRSRARLDLFGPAAQPEYGKRLEALARACGAHLHGPLRRDAVAAQLARTDLLVVPSVWFENAPLVILEALAARTPLLVSHLGGMAELVHAGEHGLHFAPGDALDLARVLGEAIDDPSHLDAFYRAGEFPPTLDEMHDAVLAVYERVLGGTRRAMKVLFLVHGYPPELSGGTERHVQQLAESLASADGAHEVVVCAGTLHGGPGAEESREEHAAPRGGTVRVLRLPRTDLYYDHWQKSSSPAIHARVRELIRAERPDVVSVHHWTRLSRDLVLAAAREGVPATVHLHDHWTSCPIAFRVKPTDGSFCESPANGMVCPPCAGALPPFTPWVRAEEHFIALAERQADLQRELKLARTVSAPSRAHADAVARFMDGALEASEVRILPPRVAARATTAVTAEPLAAGPPWTFAQWGGLSRLKGTDLLFEAVAGLRDPSVVRLELAGSLERPGFLDDLHARFPAVSYTNHGPYDAAALHERAFVSAHAAVIPTRARESYGLTFDEALDAGLPCAVVDAPAFRERAADGVGVRFFERGSASELRDMLQSWIDDPARLGALRADVERARASLPRAATPSCDGPDPDFLRLLEDTFALGRPDPASLPPEDWFSDRIKQHALEEWDRRLSQCSAAELGLG